MHKKITRVFILIAAFSLFYTSLTFAAGPGLTIENIMKNTVAQTKTDANEPRYRSVPILMFHHLYESDETKLTVHTFEEYMQTLVDAGYTALSYKDLQAFINGEIQLPTRPIIITFDDGYTSNYAYAYPILKQLELKAEIAVVGYTVGFDVFPTTAIEIIPHFTWNQALEMVKSGVIGINSHSFNLHEHATTGMDVTRLGVQMKEGETEEDYTKTLRADAISANRAIRNNLGYENTVYTYPYGAYDATTEEILKGLGISVTVTNSLGISEIEIGNPDSLRLLKRIPCDRPGLDIIKMIDNQYKRLD